MSNEEDNAEIEDETVESKAKKSTKHDSGAADLEKVTDYVEETEISSQSIGEAMKVVSGRQQKEMDDKRIKEKELSKIKINKEDVDLIVNEMELPRTVAERKLREHRGDLVQTLVTLTN